MQRERAAAEIDVDDVVGHDARAEVDRLLPHQLHQLGAGDAVLEVRGHQTATILGDGRIQVCAQVAGGKAGVVLDLGGQGELAERQRAVDAVLLGDRALEDERAEVGAGGVDGGGPAGRAAADDDDFFHAGGIGVQGSVEILCGIILELGLYGFAIRPIRAQRVVACDRPCFRQSVAGIVTVDTSSQDYRRNRPVLSAMSLVTIALVSAAVLTVAYFTYGPLLVRLFQLDPNRPTPAVEMRDDVDYAPIEPKFLLSQHFSAIAAAGPIVGPILAGVMFGWLPALIWILVGSIFIGGVHDMTALVASIRHKARSIAEVVREHMSDRSYLLFLAFVWIALVYIIVAFTDVTASSFVGLTELENGGHRQRAGDRQLVAVVPGAADHHGPAAAVHEAVAELGDGDLPAAGRRDDLGRAVHAAWTWRALLNVDQAQAQRIWGVLLLAYCLIAARGADVAAAAAARTPGWLFPVRGARPRRNAGPVVRATSRLSTRRSPVGQRANGETLVPILFITIACGACSGFHSLIACGTTSKQLRRETDARVIGYGAMLLEAMVAIISLSCVMILATDVGGARRAAEAELDLRPRHRRAFWRRLACRRRWPSRSR